MTAIRSLSTLACAATLVAASGCALTPPAPPECDGPWTAINAPRQTLPAAATAPRVAVPPTPILASTTAQPSLISPLPSPFLLNPPMSMDAHRRIRAASDLVCGQ